MSVVCINVWISPAGEVTPVNLAGHAKKAFEILYGPIHDKRSDAYKLMRASKPGDPDLWIVAEEDLIAKGWYKINQWPNSRINLTPETPLEKIASPVRKAIVDIFIKEGVPLRALKGGHPLRDWR